jgi:hypothetical protein
VPIIFKLSVVMSNISNVDIRVFVVDVGHIFHAEYIDIFMIYLHEKFHRTNINGSLDITVKLKLNIGR